MSDESPIIITNRDVYDLLKEHIGKVEDWQTVHASADTKSFNALNVKFYGILAAVVTVLGALILPHT